MYRNEIIDCKTLKSYLYGPKILLNVQLFLIKNVFSFRKINHVHNNDEQRNMCQYWKKKTCNAESKYFVVGPISVVQTLKNECIYSLLFLVIPKNPLLCNNANKASRQSGCIGQMKKDVYVKLSFEFYDIRNFFGIKVITFLSDLKKKIQIALKFFFFISNLLL